MKRRKTMRRHGYVDYPEPMVKPARRLLVRHAYMGELKCWLCQNSLLRWWNQNIRPAAYKRW